MWVNKGTEFYSRWTKSWLAKKIIKMYSTQNEGKSVIIWYRFIITLKKQICKYMNSVSKSVYINKLGDIVNKYNTYHSTIKMKPVDVKSSI